MNDFIEIRKVAEMIRRRLWLVVLLTVTAAAIGYGASQWQTPVYEATTTIMVGQLIQADQLSKTDLLTNEVLAQTYTDMALRQPILQGVVYTLGLPDHWRTLKSHINAKLVEGTQFIQITAEADSTELARALADEVVHQLSLFRPTPAPTQTTLDEQTIINEQLANLQTKIELGQARLQTMEAASVKSFEAQSIQQVQELQVAIKTLEGLISQWEDTYAQLFASLQTESHSNALTVIEPAQAAAKPIWPRTDLNIALAGAIGFLLALGLVLVLELQDDTLKSVDDIKPALGITALGAINKIAGRREQAKLLIAQGASSPVAEAYRIIRSNIEFKTADAPMKSIVVTSAGSGEGKSITVANLGIIMAHAGHRTIIVDADLRQPLQHELFQIANSIGLSESTCLPETAFGSHLLDTKVRNLQVLPSGSIPLNPAELLGSQGMRELLAALSQMADVVIIDSPPVLGLTDASILANRADGVLLVVEAGQTQRAAARQALADLQQANANLIGAILNRSRPRYRAYGGALPLFTTGDPVAPIRANRRWQWLPF
ncbi:MAG: polysaccharide biosynthesis tyrosine autokinase [Caldilineaceae bacterium]